MKTAVENMATFPSVPDGISLKNIESYHRLIVALSGGKDSVALVLHLLDIGVPVEKMELWHHDVDGPDSELMDWPVTRAYCLAFADAMGIPIYFSWKVGGFEGEMLREDSLTMPCRFECPDGSVGQSGGKRGKKTTRLMFPQVSPDLSVRWCSAYLKIDVCTAAINNQDRFLNRRTLILTGERAEEGSIGKDGKPKGRAAYKILEPHRSDNRNGSRVVRHVDVWRAVHKWTEAEVWAILEAYNVNPHPCYHCGFSRCSCMPCIFGNKDQWATVKKIDAARFEKLAKYEEQFGKTIKRKLSLRVLAEQGRPYEMNEADLEIAMSREYNENILLEPGTWKLPSGAFGDSCGPT